MCRNSNLNHYIILVVFLTCLDLSRGDNCIANCSCTTSQENLIVADCSHRYLTSVPTKLPDNLGSLDLSYNVISNPWTQELMECKNLTRLDISNNNISTLQQLVFSVEDIGLQDLNLANNHIMSIDNRTFQLFTKLLSLDISGNRITSLRENSFSGLTQLQVLNLTDNYIGLCNYSYPRLIFQDLKALEILAINFNVNNTKGNNDSNNSSINNCSALYPDQALSHLKSLKELYIDLLHYPTILGDGFRHLTQLQHIYLQAASVLPMTASKILFLNIKTSEPLNVTFISNNYTHVFFEPGVFDNLLTLHSLRFIAVFNSIEYVNDTLNNLNLQSKQFKHLEIVYIWGMIYCELGPLFMKHLHKYPLETIILDTTKIVFIDTRVVSQNFPKSLKKLSFANNKILYSDVMFAFITLPHLTYLDVSFQFKSSLVNLPINLGSSPVANYDLEMSQKRYEDKLYKSFKDQESNCKTLSELKKVNYHQIEQYKYNYILQLARLTENKQNFNFSKIMTSSSNVPILLPIKLSELYMSAVIYSLPCPELHFTSNNQLKYLDASQNNIWCLEGPVTGLKKLEIVDLRNNYCFVLSPYFFAEGPSLRKLYLSNNAIGLSLEQDSQGQTFSQLHSLEYLDISKNYIRVISYKAFLRNKKLQKLIINRNSIQDFNVCIKHLVNLTCIDLSSNDLARLSVETMTSLDEIYSVNLNLTIDLYKNNLVCDCDNTDFIDWFISTKVHFRNKEFYLCQYVNGSVINMNNLNDLTEYTFSYCLGRQLFLPVLITFLLLVICMVSLGLFCYFRVMLLFYIYVSKYRLFYNFSNRDNQQVRDVFIVYDEESPRWREFVSETVKPFLEFKGVSTYNSEIDSQVGKPIRMVVEDSILAARKTLVLLTCELFESDYHELEVNMAKLSEEMMPSKAVLFVEIEQMTDAYIPEHISRYLETSLHHYHENDPYFWDNLVKIIKS